ncbi:MAG TPA: hypothetical protein VGX23_11160 [Actinocrinis sp.]|nr:hypothetical protein [Actinocrinis sp.]
MRKISGVARGTNYVKLSWVEQTPETVPKPASGNALLSTSWRRRDGFGGGSGRLMMDDAGTVPVHAGFTDLPGWLARLVSRAVLFVALLGYLWFMFASHDQAFSLRDEKWLGLVTIPLALLHFE